MRRRVGGCILALVLAASSATSQEYRIDKPGEPTSTPVYLTRSVDGRVEVTNLPPVQEVRITGGSLDSPVEVRGEVGFRAREPLLVQVINPPEFPERMPVEGTVRLENTQPLRVIVENLPRPEREPERQFAVYHFRGGFNSKASKAQRSFQPPAGAAFHLTDLVVDARPDALLKVRLIAPPTVIQGAVAGDGQDAVPVAVVETRKASWQRLGTPVPLGGEFTLEVEAVGPGEGAPFQVVASGYLMPAKR